MQVYENMLPTYRKAMMINFIDKVSWFSTMKKDPNSLSIKEDVSDLTHISLAVLFGDLGKQCRPR